MNLSTFNNVNEVLKLVANDKGTSNEVKVDLDEATNFFGNIIANVEKALEKPGAKADKKANRLLVYPLRIDY